MFRKSVSAAVLGFSILLFPLSSEGSLSVVSASSIPDAPGAAETFEVSFAFGASEAADGFTQVTDVLYTEELGYGFSRTDGLVVSGDNVTGETVFRFNADVPNGNYTVKVDTTAESMTSEVVQSVPAKTGIQKSGDTFSVAVCDGVLDLTFPAKASVKTIEITQEPVKEKQAKPFLYAIGDSTAKNNADGALSWGNCVEGGKVLMPDAFGGFANHGMGGRNSVSYYNQGRVEAVLLAICPGDYVTVNMGINSESGEQDSYYTLISSYYIEGILQRGGIPVIVTATPDGPVGGKVSSNYDAETGKFKNSRGNGVRNNTLRQIAAEKGLALIELGQWGQDWMNTLTDDDVAVYNEANNTAYATVLEMVQSWYVDHNHYKEYLGIQIGNYLLGELAKLVEAGYEPGSVIPQTETSEPIATSIPTATSDPAATSDSTAASGSAITSDPAATAGPESEATAAPESDAAAPNAASGSEVAESITVSGSGIMQATQAEETAPDKNITLWVVAGVLAVALAGMTVVVIQSKKKKKEE